MPARKRASSTERRSSATKKKSRTSAEMCARELPASARNAMSYNEMRSALKAAGYNCGPTATSLAWAKRKEELGIVTVKGRRSAGRRTPTAVARAAGVVAAARATVAAGRARKSTERRAVSERAPARASTRGVVIMMKPQETAAAAVGFAVAGFDWAECLTNETVGRQCYAAIVKRFPTLTQGCEACPRPSPAAIAAAPPPSPAKPVIAPSPAAAEVAEKVAQQTGTSVPFVSVVDPATGKIVAAVTGKGKLVQFSNVDAPVTPATPTTTIDPSLSKAKIEALEKATPQEEQAMRQITAAVNASARAQPVKTAPPVAVVTVASVPAAVAKQQAQQSQKRAAQAHQELQAKKQESASAQAAAAQASQKAIQSSRAAAAGAAPASAAVAAAAQAQKAQEEAQKAKIEEKKAEAAAAVTAAAAKVASVRAEAAQAAPLPTAKPSPTPAASAAAAAPTAFKCTPENETNPLLIELLAYKTDTESFKRLGPNQRRVLPELQARAKRALDNVQKVKNAKMCDLVDFELNNIADIYDGWRHMVETHETPCAKSELEKSMHENMKVLFNHDTSVYSEAVATQLDELKTDLQQIYKSPDLTNPDQCATQFWLRMQPLVDEFRRIVETERPEFASSSSEEEEARKVCESCNAVLAQHQITDKKSANAYYKTVHPDKLAARVARGELTEQQSLDAQEEFKKARGCAEMIFDKKTCAAAAKPVVPSTSARTSTRTSKQQEAPSPATSRAYPEMILQGEYPNERFVPADKTVKYEFDKGYQFIWGADRKSDWFYLDRFEGSLPVFNLCTHPANETGCIRLASLQTMESSLQYPLRGYYTYAKVAFTNEKGAYIARPFNYRGERLWFYPDSSTAQASDAQGVYTYNWQLCNNQEQGAEGCTQNAPKMFGGGLRGTAYYTYDVVDQSGKLFEPLTDYDFNYYGNVKKFYYGADRTTETSRSGQKYTTGWHPTQNK